MRKIFVQIGAGRDGYDPYYTIAKSRGYTAVLLETYEFLVFRRLNGAVSFDHELTISSQIEAEEIVELLMREFAESIRLVLAGFEIYNKRSFIVAELLRCHPSSGIKSFVPLDKCQQRQKLVHNLNILQPNYRCFTSLTECQAQTGSFNFPVVLKPTNSGGGLGVHLLNDHTTFSQAIKRLKKINNYGGSNFSEFIVEDFIDGEEISLQGICQEGEAVLLTVANKVVLQQSDALGIFGFRECGHIIGVEHPDWLFLADYAKAVCKIFGYERGAFHIDIIRKDEKYYFLEMGFRFSGMGIEKVVSEFYQKSWAEMAWLSSQQLSFMTKKIKCNSFIGRLIIRDADVLVRAERLANKVNNVNLNALKENREIKYDEKLRSDQMRHGGVIGILSIESDQYIYAKSIFEQCCYGILNEQEIV